MGDELLDLREGEPGEARWRIPAGYADLSGKSYLGYAHGAAGIADTLLDLFDVTSEQRFADAALDAISWIARQAVQTLDDDSGLGWPQVESGRLHPPFWCHGATGIGRLLLHAARTCRSVAKGSRWSGPTLTPAAGYGPTRLRLRILAVAGRLVCTARRTQLKTPQSWPWADQISTAHAGLAAPDPAPPDPITKDAEHRPRRGGEHCCPPAEPATKRSNGRSEDHRSAVTKHRDQP